MDLIQCWFPLSRGMAYVMQRYFIMEDSLAEALWKISQKPTEVNNVDYNC